MLKLMLKPQREEFRLKGIKTRICEICVGIFYTIIEDIRLDVLSNEI